MKQELKWILNLLNIDISNISLICDTSYSTVYQVKMNEQVFFFKINCQNFQNESNIICYLSGLAPKNNMNIIEANKSMNCFLTKYAGESLDKIIPQNKDINLIINAIDAFQNIQKKVVKQQLINAGVRQFELAKIPSIGTSLLKDFNALNLIANINKDTDTLIDIGIIDSIEHGDFHLGNILLNNKDIVFIDFAEATLTNPIFSLLSFENTLIYRGKCDESFTHQVRNHYLSNMDENIDMALRIKAYQISKRLWPLYNMWCLSELLKTNPDVAYKEKTETKIKRNFEELVSGYQI